MRRHSGKYIALARRSGGHWYLAATNGEASPHTFVMSVPEFRGRSFTLIHDGPDGRASADQVKVENDGMLRLTLQPNSGAVWFDSMKR